METIISGVKKSCGGAVGLEPVRLLSRRYKVYE